MNELAVMEIGRNAVAMVVLLSAPMLLVALGVGLLVSLFQAVTQINEVTLSFVPKILGVFAALAVAGPWLMSTALTYTVSVFGMLPSMVR